MEIAFVESEVIETKSGIFVSHTAHLKDKGSQSENGKIMHLYSEFIFMTGQSYHIIPN